MNAVYEDFRVAIHMVWRRRWLALAVAWCLCLAGWLVLSLIPNRYESRARLSVQPQSLLPQQVGMTPNDAQKDIDRVRQTLVSTDNLIQVVRTTDAVRQVSSDADLAMMVNKLARGIKLVAQPDNVFEITAETSVSGLSNAENATLAHDVVQRLIDLFVEGTAANDRAEAIQSMRFLDAEIARREAELRDAEGRRVAFEQKYLGSLPGSGSIAQRADAIRAELASLEPNLASAQSSLAAINAQMAATPATVATPGTPVSGGRVAALEAQLADAQAKGWTDQHPDVVAIRAQLVRLRGSGAGGAASAGASSVNPLYMTMRSMQADKQATASSLAGRKAQLEADLDALTMIQVREPGIAAEQARLNQDYEALKAQYDKLTTSREEVRVRAEMAARGDAVQVRVIEPPSRPRLPSWPNRPLLLLAVLVVGLAAGIGAAFAKSQLDMSYSTAGRLAKATGLPVLGSISERLNPVQVAGRRQRQKWFAGAAGGLAGVFLLLLAIEFVERGLMA